MEIKFEREATPEGARVAASGPADSFLRQIKLASAVLAGPACQGVIVEGVLAALVRAHPNSINQAARCGARGSPG